MTSISLHIELLVMIGSLCAYFELPKVPEPLFQFETTFPKEQQ